MATLGMEAQFDQQRRVVEKDVVLSSVSDSPADSDASSSDGTEGEKDVQHVVEVVQQAEEGWIAANGNGQLRNKRTSLQLPAKKSSIREGEVSWNKSHRVFNDDSSTASPCSEESIPRMKSGRQSVDMRFLGEKRSSLGGNSRRITMDATPCAPWFTELASESDVTSDSNKQDSSPARSSSFDEADCSIGEHDMSGPSGSSDGESSGISDDRETSPWFRVKGRETESGKQPKSTGRLGRGWLRNSLRGKGNFNSVPARLSERNISSTNRESRFNIFSSRASVRASTKDPSTARDPSNRDREVDEATDIPSSRRGSILQGMFSKVFAGKSNDECDLKESRSSRFPSFLNRQSMKDSSMDSFYKSMAPEECKNNSMYGKQSEKKNKIQKSVGCWGSRRELRMDSYASSVNSFERNVPFTDMDLSMIDPVDGTSEEPGSSRSVLELALKTSNTAKSLLQQSYDDISQLAKDAIQTARQETSSIRSRRKREGEGMAGGLLINEMKLRAGGPVRFSRHIEFENEGMSDSSSIVEVLDLDALLESERSRMTSTSRL